ncbi:MAG: hypothetical protein ACYDCC_07925 [Actinomycetota bacterium]
MAQTKSESQTEAEGHKLFGLRLPIPIEHIKGMAPGKKILFFGALGALAVGGLLDWPVALVVAAGTLIAEQQAHEATKNGKKTQ